MSPGDLIRAIVHAVEVTAAVPLIDDRFTAAAPSAMATIDPPRGALPLFGRCRWAASDPLTPLALCHGAGAQG